MIQTARVEAAKAYLGTGWVLHPDYRPEDHPAHRAEGPYILPRYWQNVPARRA